MLTYFVVTLAVLPLPSAADAAPRRLEVLSQHGALRKAACPALAGADTGWTGVGAGSALLHGPTRLDAKLASQLCVLGDVARRRLAARYALADHLCYRLGKLAGPRMLLRGARAGTKTTSVVVCSSVLHMRSPPRGSFVGSGPRMSCPSGLVWLA